ncbi:hypothetical protein L226DRAFT_375822 [Lentinus tigrinus ALCF2SS1-7]|uniref:uncharacterized protein n=1 Tax=Lentinus tigrinus ALCF2SS1-7 TaxID=1328758 RepID=UPI0011664019|nr:hypothetical protein L226DRAFT_375822 [Lentinus tigrinus ALCF2SS1-7]
MEPGGAHSQCLLTRYTVGRLRKSPVEAVRPNARAPMHPPRSSFCARPMAHREASKDQTLYENRTEMISMRDYGNAQRTINFAGPALLNPKMPREGSFHLFSTNWRISMLFPHSQLRTPDSPKGILILTSKSSTSRHIFLQTACAHSSLTRHGEIRVTLLCGALPLPPG